MEKIFATMLARYGRKWSEQWPPDAMHTVKAVWARETAELSDLEISAGLYALMIKGNPFPPTLPEFFSACRPPPSKIVIPPVEDHKALELLAQQLGVQCWNAPSYAALRSRIAAAVAERERTPLQGRLQ